MGSLRALPAARRTRNGEAHREVAFTRVRKRAVRRAPGARACRRRCPGRRKPDREIPQCAHLTSGIAPDPRVPPMTRRAQGIPEKSGSAASRRVRALV